MYDAPNAVEELKQPRKHPTAEKVEAIKDGRAEGFKCEHGDYYADSVIVATLIPIKSRIPRKITRNSSVIFMVR